MIPGYYVLFVVVAVFFVGRMYGIVEGQRRFYERIERQRGAEIKTLLEHIRMTWHK